MSQASFPRTSAWDNLKKALRGTYDEAVWDLDDRGNELMVVKSVKEAE